MPNQRIRGNQITDQRTIVQNEHEEQADAKRVLLVDENGNPVNQDNPLPTEAVVNLSATKPDTQTILNVPVNAADTEFSAVIPAKTEIFTIRVKSNKAIVLKYSFQAGASGTNFVQVRPGSVRKITGLSFDVATTIYFQLNRLDGPQTVVEIETWRV